MKHLGFASVAAVQQYLRYAKAKHVDTDRLLEQSGLEELKKESASGRITGEQFQLFLSHLIHEANDPILGLNSSLYVQTQSYNILGLIALNLRTLNEVIERVPVFERLVGDMGVTQIQRSEQTLTQTWTCQYPDPYVAVHMVDNVLASWTLFSRWLLKQNLSPKKVKLVRPKPDAKTTLSYQHLYQCPIEFGASKNQIVLDQSVLNAPLQRQRQDMKDLLEGQARSALSKLRKYEDTFTKQIAEAINAHLQLGIAQKELIANEFNLSERSIQRRLAKENTSYQALLDATRYERAQSFLLDTELNASEIAHNLGYTDDRCFYRSFKKWSGDTPQNYRLKNKAL